MSVVAHFCNANMAAHQGKLEAVYNTKIYDAHPPQECYKYLVNDFEGGRADSIQPYPWQTDTCIGNWHYYRGVEVPHRGRRDQGIDRRRQQERQPALEHPAQGRRQPG